MQKIAIITDSASDLSLETLKENNINLFPLRIIYSDKEFEDKIDITSEEVYKSLDKEIPSTSLPGADTCHKVLDRLVEEGYTHVIGVTVSASLSGTFNFFRLMLEDYPTLKSFVFDSKIIGYCQGVICLEASKLVQAGNSFEEIVEKLPEIASNVSGYFTLDTLEYLKKGGRIGRVAGAIGQLFHLKPIITMDEAGVYKMATKARGRKQSLSKLTEQLTPYLDKGKCKVWVLEGGCIDEATTYMNSLRKIHNIEVMGIAPVGPMVAAHSGPGMIGLTIQRVD